MTDVDIDVALSFASADRAFVEDVAQALRDVGVSVIYDQFLEDVYHQRARSVAVFVSRTYIRRMWTVAEPEMLRARMRSDHLIPVRLDGAELPGVPSTTDVVDARQYTGQEVAKLIAAKFIAARVEPRPVGPGPQAPVGIPMTVDAKVRLVSFRPPGWEHLLLAGTIWPAAEALEAQRMDLELAYAGRTGEHVPAARLPGRIGVWLDELATITGRLTALVQPARLAWALGRPGEPGDPTRIEHLGRRFVQAYGELLDWHRRVAGAATERDGLPILARLARLAERPVQQTRGFVDDLADAARAIAEGCGPVTAVPVSLALDLDDEQLDEFLATVASRP